MHLYSFSSSSSSSVLTIRILPRPHGPTSRWSSEEDHFCNHLITDQFSKYSSISDCLLVLSVFLYMFYVLPHPRGSMPYDSDVIQRIFSWFLESVKKEISILGHFSVCTTYFPMTRFASTVDG